MDKKNDTAKKTITTITATAIMLLLNFVTVYADDTPTPTETPTRTATNAPTQTKTLYPCPEETYDVAQQVSMEYAMMCGHCIPSQAPTAGLLEPITIPTYGMFGIEEETPTPTMTQTGTIYPTETPTGTLTVIPVIPQVDHFYLIEVEPRHFDAYGHNYEGVYAGLNPCNLDLHAGWVMYGTFLSEVWFDFVSGETGRTLNYPGITEYVADYSTQYQGGAGEWLYEYMPETFEVTMLTEKSYAGSASLLSLQYYDTSEIEETHWFGICYGDNDPGIIEETPTPTPTANGLCDEWDYKDYEPIAGWDGFTIIDSGECEVIIPPIDLPIPAVTLIKEEPFAFEFPGLELCYNVIDFGDVDLLGVNFSMDLLALPFAAMLIGLIIRL